jgi:hypothetical protein
LGGIVAPAYLNMYPSLPIKILGIIGLAPVPWLSSLGKIVNQDVFAIVQQALNKTDPDIMMQGVEGFVDTLVRRKANGGKGLDEKTRLQAIAATALIPQTVSGSFIEI